MDVIGVGFGRTGTLSLKVALEQLGFGPCMHMLPLLDDPWRATLLSHAADGDMACLDAAFDDYRSTVDWPGAYFWRELTARHPRARVILTVRDPDRWYDSAFKTIYTAATTDGSLPPSMAAGREMAEKTVWDGTFGGRFADREATIQLFQDHNAAVRAEIAPDRLLEFTVGEGWGPLCEFLGVPAPATPFPRLNDESAFHQNLQERMTLTAARSGS
ncbi:sulfotransferase family protein [Paractinoplanes globisporus]|uniref:Sulfotransferase family protein n=1 Tax=Paractinoplanes globisporus TaxID=113565 RepID=A0ABW6WP27_9ACTN|nr:sulfotransferase family protein [Actinoplanes globisporus]